MMRYLLVTAAILSATPALAQDTDYPDPADKSDTFTLGVGAGWVPEGNNPLEPDVHAARHQAVFAEHAPQGLDLAGITAIERRQGNQGIERHRVLPANREAASLAARLSVLATINAIRRSSALSSENGTKAAPRSAASVSPVP